MTDKQMTKEEQAETAREFRHVVNMPQAALQKWLDSDDSKAVGMTPEGNKVTQEGDGESVGHEMGRHILDLKAKQAAQLGDEDYRMMRKVVGYVHRHLKQRPHGDVTDTRWRRSLMNWGHDPLK